LIPLHLLINSIMPLFIAGSVHVYRHMPKSVTQRDLKTVPREASAESVTGQIREREGAARKTDSKKQGGVSTGAGSGAGGVAGMGAGAVVGAEEGTGAGTGMAFELDAVLTPLVKTPYSAFGHTHHITGKKRGEWRRAYYIACWAF
jgi:hypothetical protein